MSIDAWDPIDDGDPFLDLRTLDEMLGGDAVDASDAVEPDTGDDEETEADEARVGVAMRDLVADAHRTGQQVGVADLNRTASRHKLTVTELAILELRAEAHGLLPGVSGEDASGDLEWDALDRGSATIPGTNSLQAWFATAGAYPVLDQPREVALARAIESGHEAAAALEVRRAMDPALEERLWQIVERGARAKAAFTTANLRLVASIAKRYRGQGLDFLDLLQEGVLGLMRAVEKFEWRYGYKFSTYATWWIRQSVQRGVANQGRSVRIPVHILEKISKLKRTARKLEIRLQREPTIDELAEAQGVDPAEVAFLKDLEQDVISLDRPVGGDPEAVTLKDLVPNADGDEFTEMLDRVNHEELVAEFLTLLSEREALVVSRRFGLDDGTPDTLDAIGLSLGMTRERVRQIEVASLKKLANSRLAQQRKDSW